MGQESCVAKYGSLFSPTLKQIFIEHDLSIPYILEFLEDDTIVCDDKECDHHVFHKCMEFGSSNTGLITQVETDWVKQCHGCMCLLPLIDHELTLQDIADAMGVSRQAVQKHEASGLLKSQNQYKIDDNGDVVKKI